MGASANKNKLYYAWWPNLDSNLPIIAATLGFIYAIILLYPKDGKQYTFHQLQLQNKKELVLTVINNRIAALDKATAEVTMRKPATSIDLTTTEQKKAAADAFKSWSDSLRTIATLKGNALAEQNRLRHFNTDTSLNAYTRYFSADRESFLNAINSFPDKDSMIQVPVSMYDTCSFISSAPFITQANLQLKKQSQTLMNWVNSNGSFGLWFVFSLAQMSMWFLFAVLLTGIVRSTNGIAPALSFNLKNAAFFSILPFLVILVFAWLLYYKLIDGYVIPDAFFMQGYNSHMLWYGVVGYMVALLCFSGYLFLSNKLELLNDNAQSKRLTITSNQQLADDYTKLAKAFDNSFLLSAIILSVFVLWMGIQFNGINSTEAMRFYRQLSGKPLLNPDFVYLIAILHSMLLLVFYVPVRLRFNSLEIQQQNAAAKAATPNNKKLLSSLWDSISTVLVTASPIIVTVIEKIVSGFLK